tara:strand:- start:226 stop:390 length:165 start_codon:yes stop_codon:yes gene_type:complete
MPRITIDVELPYGDMDHDDSIVVIEDVVDEDVEEEVAITCPTCGSVITEEVEAD